VSRATGGEGRGGGHRLDALLWAALSFAVLLLVPIGWVSGDALDQGGRYVRGVYEWDPNHLLLEPVGALWVHLLAAMGSQTHFVDALKLLSALAGAIAVGLFRATLAARLAASRSAANFGTCWLAFGSAFLRL
jgi:hypothetical protein